MTFYRRIRKIFRQRIEIIDKKDAQYTTLVSFEPLFFGEIINISIIEKQENLDDGYIKQYDEDKTKIDEE